MRNKFDEQLAQLNVELVKMGSLCELAISDAIKGLMDGNSRFLQLARDTDSEIDEKEREIERMCFRLLLQQQPVAKDLRVVSAALKMISDMERIGDQASDIAEIALHIQEDETKAEGSTHLRAMADAASSMVADAVKSFVDKDLELARRTMKADDVVDRYFDQVKEEIAGLIRQEKADAAACLDTLMIAKYLERIGDHAVNVAEWVEFSITGNHRDGQKE